MKITSVYSKYCESHEENMPSSKSTPKNDCLDLKYDNWDFKHHVSVCLKQFSDKIFYNY